VRDRFFELGAAITWNCARPLRHDHLLERSEPSEQQPDRRDYGTGALTPRGCGCCCSFERPGQSAPPAQLAAFVDLVRRVEGIGCEVIKVEGLYTFDGVAGFSVAQGQ
jgi:hypothetical protein